MGNLLSFSVRFGTMLLLLESLIMFMLCTDAGTVKNSSYIATAQLLCINIAVKLLLRISTCVNT